MKHVKFTKLICFAAVAVILLLSGGCMTYRGFMSDKRILAEAQSFVENLSLENCDYWMPYGARVTDYPGGSSAMPAGYPDGFLFRDRTKTYYIQDAYSAGADYAREGLPPDDPSVEEVPDTAFDAYDALAKGLMDVLKIGMTEPGLLRLRYNYDQIRIEDYLYCDFEDACIESEAFIDLVDKRYDGGFIVFIYQGEHRTVSRCSIILWEYAEDGVTQLRTYFDFGRS